MWKILVLMLLPLPALAVDAQDAAAGGGGVAATAASAYAAKKALDARKRAQAKKIVTVEAEKWGWTAKRQASEINQMLRRGK